MLLKLKLRAQNSNMIVWVILNGEETKTMKYVMGTWLVQNWKVRVQVCRAYGKEEIDSVYHFMYIWNSKVWREKRGFSKTFRKQWKVNDWRNVGIINVREKKE